MSYNKLTKSTAAGMCRAILEWVAPEVEWEFVGSAQLPYAGPRKTARLWSTFFTVLGLTEDVDVFEPSEFIAAVRARHRARLGKGDWPRYAKKTIEARGRRSSPSRRVKSRAGVALPTPPRLTGFSQQG
jgi:hypothetical protein